jgi:1,4-alpha-glucan branching enzyme
MIYAYSENYVLPLSHDEVVHGKGSLLRKMAGDEWRQFAGLRSLLAYMWAHPGKQLLFMGGEFGQGDEWSADTGLQWHLLDYPSHQGVQRLVTDLNQAYARQPALWRQDARPEGFSWIDANDTAGNVLSFVRLAGDLSGPADTGPAASGTGGSAPGGDDILACVVNFSGAPHHGYRVGLPRAGRWRELINTDAAIYGGSGVGNLGAVQAVPEPWHGMPASAEISIPPLGALWLAPEPPAQ